MQRKFFVFATNRRRLDIAGAVIKLSCMYTPKPQDGARLRKDDVNAGMMLAGRGRRDRNKSLRYILRIHLFCSSSILFFHQINCLRQVFI